MLRSYPVIGTLAVLALSFACTSERNAELKPERFVGEYVYYSDDKGSPHDPDRLTLRADGKYTLVHMPGGRPGATEEGAWHLYDTPEPSIAFGDTVYPIEIKSNHVRLLIDLDVGHWYEKTG